MTLRFVLSLITTINRNDTVAWLVRLTWLLVTLAHFIVYCLGRRFKDKFIPMMIGLYVVAQVSVMFSLLTTVSHYKDDVPIEVQLRDNLLIFTVIYCLLLTPSIKYIFFCYVPLYMSMIIWCIKKHEGATQHILAAVYA